MRRALPYAFFGAVTLFVFWKFLFIGQTLYCVSLLESHFGREERAEAAWFKPPQPRFRITDSVILFPTHYAGYNDGLKSGELRLWNPHLFGGTPIYANPMIQPFYPPNLVLHLIFAPETAHGLSLMIHFLFSGVAMFWALRALRRSDAASVAGGLIWMLSGYVAVWFNTAILLGASVWAPLALLWIVQGLERKDLTRAGLAALAMGMAILGSHPQHAVHLFIFFLAWLATGYVRDRDARPFTLRFTALFASLSIGVGLAAILTRLDTIAHGYRVTGTDFEVIYDEPFALVTHILGLAIGKAHFPEHPTLQYEITCHAGVAATALAIVGILRGFRNPQVRFVALFGAATILFAFVKPFAWALQQAPILNLSPPSRWLYVLGFCVPILAAFGFDAAAKQPGKLAVATAVASCLFLGACLQGVGLLRFSNPAVFETMIGFGAAVAAMVAMKRRPRLAPAFWMAALLFDLLPLFLYYNPHGPTKILRDVPESVSYVRELEARKGPWRAGGALASIHSTSGFLSVPELIHSNNIMALYGVEAVGGFDAIFPAHYVRFAAKAGAEVSPAGRSIMFANYDSSLLDAAGLKYLFMPFDIRPHARYSIRREFGKLKLYENTKVLPRAWMVAGVRVARDADEALAIMDSSGFKPREEVILESAEPAPAGPVSCDIKWTHRSSDRLELAVTADSDGMLVLADTDYPGWEATVDGRDTPIFRANAAFRAVAVPQGTHLVEFRFRPESARHGLLASLLFALATLGLGLRHLWEAVFGRCRGER